jgi:hypothetical protein
VLPELMQTGPKKKKKKKVQHRLPDDGPDGPKYVGAIMVYFNCIF